MRRGAACFVVCVTLACGSRAANRDGPAPEGGSPDVGAEVPETGAPPTADAPVEQAVDAASQPDVKPDASLEHVGDALEPGDGSGDVATSHRPSWPATLPPMGPELAEAPAGEPVCYVSGWCWSNPPTLGGRVSVWAGAADDVWTVGPHGTTRHFDGQMWKTVATPTTRNLLAVWGASATAVWAVGDHALLRWDGTKWSALPFDHRADFLTGRSDKEVWLANSDGNGGVGHLEGNQVVFDQDWSTWALYQHPDGTLYGAVTEGGSMLFSKPLGGPFSMVRAATNIAASGVWASGPQDVWLVDPLTVSRFNGTAWSSVFALDAAKDKYLVGDVRGTSANDVWITATEGSMLRWNGARLDRWPTGAQGLRNISVRAPNDVWAAGESGALVHFDGTGWRRHFSGPQIDDLFDMARVGADEVWAVGRNFGFPAVLRYKPTTGWRSLETPLPAGGLTSVSGLAADDVWVAGGGTVAHWDGARWTSSPVPPVKESYVTVWAAAHDDVWAGGPKLIRWNGSAWSETRIDGAPSETYWAQIAGTSKDDVWLRGSTPSSQSLWQWNGTKWLDHTAGAPDSIGVAVRAPNDVFAWTAGAIRHYDGKDWTLLPTIPTNDAPTFPSRGLSARAGELWAISEAGLVDVWNGSTWTRSDDLGELARLNVMLATDDAVFLSGFYGAPGILRKPR